MKTQEDVDNLKSQWVHDPCWDIYETEGFEDYRDELKLFQQNAELAMKQYHKAEMECIAVELGVPGNLLLAERFSFLQTKIDALKCRLEKLENAK